MVDNVAHSLLRSDEQAGYYSDVLKAFKGHNLDVLQLRSFVDGLTLYAGQAEKAIHQIQASELTSTAHELEKVRDESFVAFRNYAEAGTHRPDEAWAKAAEKICLVIRAHDWSLHYRGTKVQSKRQASLNTELEKRKNQDAMEAIQATEWYRDMVRTNDQYLEIKEQLINQKAQKEKFDTIEIFKLLRQTGEELFDAIRVLHKISGNEAYVSIANTINSYTEDYMNTARTRKTKSENLNAEVSE